jgi:hypothetical protein
MKLRVVVCTNRVPDDVKPALLALVREGVPGDAVLLVVSGLSSILTRAHEQTARALLPGIHVLDEPRPGLSFARNRALSVCADSSVLAFIDDDVVVGDGWYEQLQLTWVKANDRVACIGGPIKPRFTVDRPHWLSDALLPVLTVLDYGPSPQELDPGLRTVYGANMSFRCGPLRQVGGFNPAYGHNGRYIWFSEEDEVQQALHKANYTIHYQPEIWVWHVIDAHRLERFAFIQRRFRYGATLGTRNARSRQLALRQCLRSGLGVIPAALARNDKLMMERMVRACENAGVLLASLIRPKQF